jgi:Arabinose-binding domain of AraC transcription regulator, N-term
LLVLSVVFVNGSVINPVVLRHMFAELSAQQIDPALLCRGLGLDVSGFGLPDARVSPRQASLLIDRALRLNPDHALGHKVGLRRTLVSSGFLGLALASTCSLEQVLALIARYCQVHGTLLDVRIETRSPGPMHVFFSQDRRLWLRRQRQICLPQCKG